MLGGHPYRDQRDRGDRRPYHRSHARNDENAGLDDIEIRLRGLIVKIGDKIAPELKENLPKMTNILNSDFEKFPDTVKNTLYACVSDIPAKAPVYGSLMGLLNASNNEIVAQLMKGINEMLTTATETSDWFTLKKLFRFYAELVNANVIRPSSYSDLINNLLEGLEAPNQPRRRLDCLVYIILSALPWCGKELNDRVPADLEQILQKVETYMQRRGKVDTLTMIKPWQQNYDIPGDTLLHLWSLLKQVQNDGWDVPILAKPYQWFDKEFTNSLQHDVPRIKLPAHTGKSAYVSPQRILKFLVDEEGNSLPSTPQHDSLAYFLVHDVIADTIRTFEPNRKECEKYLLAVGSSFEPGYFYQANQDDEMDTDATEWSLPDILVEAVFSQMLLLPASPFRQAFYACLLFELSRAEGFPMALGRGVKTLFDRLEHMDTECIYRLWCWFAHQLSNFGFQWDWKSWRDALSLDPFHPKVCFIRETLDKEIHLSFYENIKNTISKDYSSKEVEDLIGTVEPRSHFSYGAEDHPLHKDAKKMVNVLRDKNAYEERVRDELNGVQEAQGDPEIVRDILIQCLLEVGSKSFSHALSVIERHNNILLDYNKTPEERLRTVHIVASFWRDNTQFLSILLDKLQNYHVVDPTTVITWSFEPEQVQNAGRSYIWEILKNTLSKVAARVARLKSTLEHFEEMHASHETERAKGPMDEEAEADAQQERDTLERYRDKLNVAESQRREAFVEVFTHFVRILSEMQNTLSAQDKESKSNWTYTWVEGWFREILRSYHNDCASFFVTLESLVFTSNVDPQVLAIFQETRALHEQENAVI